MRGAEKPMRAQDSVVGTTIAGKNMATRNLRNTPEGVIRGCTSAVLMDVSDSVRCGDGVSFTTIVSVGQGTLVLHTNCGYFPESLGKIGDGSSDFLRARPISALI